MASEVMNMTADELETVTRDLVQVARLALAGGGHETTPVLRRLARKYRDSHPAMASALIELLRDSPVRAAGTLMTPVPQPTDTDSRLPLVREEYPVVLAVDPILSTDVHAALQQLAR